MFFTHVGGKARLHTIVKALRAVAVPTSVVADIDILRNPIDVQRVVEALGAHWSDFEAAVNKVKSTVDALPSETLVENLVGDFRIRFW